MNDSTDIIVSLISRIREKSNRFIIRELSSRGLDGLKPIHGDLLLALFRHDRPTMKELAHIVDRKKSTVTTLVTKLIQLGYVRRDKDDQDFRIFRISLTPKGLALKSDLMEISRTLLAKVYKDMPEADQKAVVKGLNRINDGW